MKNNNKQIQIGKIISQDFKNCGMNTHDADVLGNQIQTVYNNNKDYLDFNFSTQFIKVNAQQRLDRLVELAFVDFLRKSKFNLEATKKDDTSTSNLDVIIKNFGYGEFNCLHCSQQIKTIEDFKSRLTHGLNKKIIKTWMELQKSTIEKTKPIILFYCYSDLLEKDALDIIIKDVNTDKIPLEVECLCGEDIQNLNGSIIQPRYFVDKKMWISTDNKEILENKNNLYKIREQKNKNGETRYEVLVDMTYISGVVFSPFINNSLFNDVLDKDNEYYWHNDLTLIHNPNARNSFKKKTFSTRWEYVLNKNRIRNGYHLKVKEIHKTNNPSLTIKTYENT